jgi:hypothetical protein
MFPDLLDVEEIVRTVLQEDHSGRRRLPPPPTRTFHCECSVRRCDHPANGVKGGQIRYAASFP